MQALSFVLLIVLLRIAVSMLPAREGQAQVVEPQRSEAALAGAVPIAQTQAGTVRGVFANGLLAFRGVPYAAPPLRWKGAPEWPPYTARRDELMELGANPRVRRDFRKRQLDAQEAAWRAGGDEKARRVDDALRSFEETQLRPAD